MSNVELDEESQRKLLRMNGWIPIGTFGQGGGARVFKVVAMDSVTRLSEPLVTATTHDREKAWTQALSLAQIITEIIEGTQTVIAAGKVTTRDKDFRMKREIETLRDVQHPNLIRLLKYNIDDPRWYVMPAMRGGTLKDASFLHGNLPAVVKGMIQVAGALAALHGHEKQVIHRDIKPGNIFLSDTRDWILGDPGVAYRDDGGDETQTRAVSKDWFPRWYDDQLGHTPKVDLYLLAATVLWTLIGEKPLAPHFVRKPKFHLPSLFPNAPGIEDLYRLCTSLIVDDPEEMPYGDARDLVDVLNKLAPAINNDHGWRVEQDLRRLQKEPALIFSYHSSQKVSGSVAALRRRPIWIPKHCTRLLVWIDSEFNNEHGVEIWDDTGQVQYAESGVLNVGVPNGFSVPPEARGTWTLLDVRGRSGLVEGLRVFACA
jgi:serine/threonine protein kinase